MADDKGQPTWDERMDALRMNLELMGYRIEDSRKEFAGSLEASRINFENELAAHRADVAAEMEASRRDFRERSDVLIKAIGDLLIATGAVTLRVERIERKIA